jgi:ADP-ribose pyrophosphatase
VPGPDAGSRRLSDEDSGAGFRRLSDEDSGAGFRRLSDEDSGAGFRRLSDEEVLGGWFSVSRARFLDPDGMPFERQLVHHPGAVAVVPVGDDGTVTLIRQFRPAVGRMVLEIPAGTRDVNGEAPEETARRELAEEAGLQASRLEHLVTTFNTPGYSDQATALFLATGLSACPTARSGVEERWMTVEHVRLDEATDRLRAERVPDETTLLGVLLARATLAGRG